MTTPSPTRVFKSFEREDLLHIIKYRNIEVLSKLVEVSTKDLVKLLVEDVCQTGLQLLFEDLDKKTLLAITKALDIVYPGYDEDVKPTVRLMAKRLVVAVGEASTAKHWFTNDCADHLGAILIDLEIDEEVSTKDKPKAVQAILAEANSFGIENCLSAFSVDLLKRFAEGSGLTVYGGSREKILKALMERSDMEEPVVVKKKKKKVTEEPSETRPKIAKGISKVDLNSWYYAADLQEWCKDRDLPHNMSKKLLIKQILDFFDGKEIVKKQKKEKPEPKPKAPKKPRKRAPIGQAKRPKRKPKKKATDAKKGEEGEGSENKEASKKTTTKTKRKADAESDEAPPPKKPKTKPVVEESEGGSEDAD